MEQLLRWLETQVLSAVSFMPPDAQVVIELQEHIRCRLWLRSPLGCHPAKQCGVAVFLQRARQWVRPNDGFMEQLAAYEKQLAE